MENIDILMVIAHPDDDAIFAYFLQQQFHCFKWHIVCCTYNENSNRGKELLQWQSIFDSTVIFLDLPDCAEEEVEKSPFQVTDLTTKLINLDYNPKLIITHNSIGEYGHAQHIIVNKAVSSLYSNIKIIFFGYGLKNANMIITKDSKKERFKSIYKSQLWIPNCFNPTIETFLT
jgi:LmbE family N-acetylglucosaminyl deacetylase